MPSLDFLQSPNVMERDFSSGIRRQASKAFQKTEAPILQKIKDCVEYNRLQYVAQLGGLGQIRPEVSHTRQEHSEGVAQLARIACIAANLDKDTTKCVVLAALLHDSGHGPFSHTFEKAYDRWLQKRQAERDGCSHADISDDDDERVRHEDVSLAAATSVITQLLPPNEVPKIAKEVRGIISPTGSYTTGHYAIVNNLASGLDVDKFDYLLRDLYYHLPKDKRTEAVQPFHTRLIEMLYRLRVVDIQPGEGSNKALCFWEGDARVLRDLSVLRWKLMVEVYQAQMATRLEVMMEDLLLLLDEEQGYFKAYQTAAKGEQYGESCNGGFQETSAQLQSFLQLTDQRVLTDAKYGSPSAMTLADAIQRQDLYPCVLSYELETHVDGSETARWFGSACTAGQDALGRKLMQLPSTDACAEYIRQNVNSVLAYQLSESKADEALLLPDRPGWAGIGDVHVVIFDAHRGKKEVNPVALQDFYRENGSQGLERVQLSDEQVSALEDDNSPLRTWIVRVVLRTSITCPEVAQQQLRAIDEWVSTSTAGANDE